MSIGLIILAGFLVNALITGAAIWFVLRRTDQRFAAQAARSRALHDSLLGKLAQLESALQRESQAARQAEQNLTRVLKCLTTKAIRDQGADEIGDEPKI